MNTSRTPRRGARRATIAALSATLLLSAAACGDDDEDADLAEAPAATAAPTATEAEPVGTDAPEATGAPAGSDVPAATGAPTEPVDIAPEGCDEVVVGTILSLSGPFSQLGTDGEVAANAFFEAHPEVLGTPFRVQIENDRSDPTAAAEAAKKLSSDPCVVALTGPSVTATMVAALPVLLEADRPVIVNTPVPYPGYNEEPFVFSPNLTPLVMQKARFVDYFEAVGVTNPIIITGDDATGDAVQQLYTADDLTVSRVPLAVNDYEPQLAALQEDGHDAVAYIGSGGQPPAHIARGMDALGWDVPLFLAPSNLTADFLNVAGEAAEGARGFIWPAGAGPEQFADNPEQGDAVQALHDAIADDIDLAMRPNIGYIWDNYLSLYNAIETAQSTDADALREVLESQDFWGANGRVIRKPVGQPDADHAGVQYESAQFAIVQDGQLVPFEG